MQPVIVKLEKFSRYVQFCLKQEIEDGKNEEIINQLLGATGIGQYARIFETQLIDLCSYLSEIRYDSQGNFVSMLCILPG